jgi:hypothetical protein
VNKTVRLNNLKIVSMEQWVSGYQQSSGKRLLRTAVMATSLLISLQVNAQDAIAGINDANTKVRSYYAAGTNLMYAVGAVLGLIGAVKVYQKWNSGDPDTGKVAAAWFGSCIFLVVVATVIRSFFGV